MAGHTGRLDAEEVAQQRVEARGEAEVRREAEVLGEGDAADHLDEVVVRLVALGRPRHEHAARPRRGDRVPRILFRARKANT